jgi:hypothetical protein
MYPAAYFCYSAAQSEIDAHIELYLAHQVAKMDIVKAQAAYNMAEHHSRHFVNENEGSFLTMIPIFKS